MPALANYRAERNAIKQLSEALCAGRVALIRGKARVGKSALLRWLDEEARRSCSMAHVEFKGIEPLSPELIVETLVSLIGRERCPRYAAAAASERSRIKAQITNCSVVG